MCKLMIKKIITTNSLIFFAKKIIENKCFKIDLLYPSQNLKLKCCERCFFSHVNIGLIQCQLHGASTCASFLPPIIKSHMIKMVIGKGLL